MESASQWVAESMLYSFSALLPAPEVKLSKTAFMASEDMVWEAAFSGCWSSSFSLKTLNTIIPRDDDDCLEHLLSFLIREAFFADSA